MRHPLTLLKNRVESGGREIGLKVSVIITIRGTFNWMCCNRKELISPQSTHKQIKHQHIPGWIHGNATKGCIKHTNLE